MVRASKVWNGLIVFLGGAIGLVASIMLTLEAYWRALKPKTVFSCDVNAKLSCSAVAGSWQSTLIRLPEGPVPNAVLGIAAFTVILTLGVVYACGVRMPTWFNWLFRLGVVLELVFASWLLYQSMFVIKAMCPWCLAMDGGSLLMFIGMIRLWFADHDGLRGFIAGAWSLLLEVVIIAAAVVAVTLHYAGLY